MSLGGLSEKVRKVLTWQERQAEMIQEERKEHFEKGWGKKGFGFIVRGKTVA